MLNQFRSALSHPQRSLLATVLLLSVCVIFWFSSRYPDLDEKALMGGSINLQDPLSFEAAYQIDPTWPLWKQIITTTINWVLTNKNGMIFGVLFGATILTFLRYLRQKSFRNGFANSFYGFVLGTPLGVCVNCAAPIAAGLYRGGSRAETTVSAMISSPTFNVIVLSMLVSLFPFHLVLIKLVFTLGLVLLVVPIVSRIFNYPSNDQALDIEVTCPVELDTKMESEIETFAEAAFGFIRDFTKDLIYIVSISVPLMLLAGLLGSIVATIVPFEIFADIPVNVFSILLAALLGIFAPVPMGFDIILAATLLSNGTPTILAMILLFTLGSYSIYSHIIISRTISFWFSNVIAISIILLAVIAGLVAGSYEKWQIQRTIEKLEFSSFHQTLEEMLVSSSYASETSFLTDQRTTVQVSSVPFSERSKDGDHLFFRHEAWHRGVDRENNFGLASTFAPYDFAPGSSAATDFDKDGDQDLLIANIDTNPGVMLFENDGKGKFERFRLELGFLESKTVFAAVPVDIDDDTWPDLFIQTYLHGNFVVINQKGHFSEQESYRVENRKDALLTLTSGFGDIDRDGDLDAVLGNHHGSRMGRFPGSRAVNRIVYNENGKLTGSKFFEHGGEPGDTLSVLFSDINMDGKLDFAEANDYNQPDLFFFGDGEGGFKKITRQDGIMPVAPETTMSIKTADFDNDGRFEIFSTQIAGGPNGMSEKLLLKPLEEFCASIERQKDRESCQQNIDTREWNRPGGFRLTVDSLNKCATLSKNEELQCKALVMRDIAVKTANRKMCESIPDRFIRQKFSCRIHFELKREPKPLVYEDEIQQIKGRNILLTPADDETFVEVTQEAGLELGGWSWDVKAYAFRNSEYQDLFIMNGFWGLHRIAQSKVFLQNTGGLKFQDKTREAGAEDYGIIASAAGADFDNDGDIDLIASSQNGPLVAFWNNNQDGNAVIIELEDAIGNSYGIGSKIRIRYGERGDRMQLRELQLSGGFSAYNAPYVHFGLGGYDSFSELEVEWSTGEKTVLNSEFLAGRKYTVKRVIDSKAQN